MDDEVGSRGALDIRPGVLRKVATRAVSLVDGVGHGPSVKVHDEGGVLDVAVRIALHYPSPVLPAATAVRRSVAGEVERITGYRVRDVTVTVAALRPAPRPRVG
ncbi:hypothetical protein [Saccharothrix obliqua]|uniref:hypothetical protein n=1 Tax=Saccharothrix obliqua TaxID=2861747 RepID=UPI0027E22776|nr:hypothetical protein [Saccharothrix obliqua]